ncbi:MAG: DEAD/DEAH box helicase [Oscillospiraceae bacterium]|nr:DEAD/DEAH box helicase [Oscillospiraceae bacterium]
MLSGNRRPLVVAPCGSGKTVIFCDLAGRTQAKGKRIVVLVHRIELMAQTLGTFTQLGVSMDTIEVHMAFSYSKHLDRHLKPDLIITDEAHFSAANTWMKIYQTWPDVCVIGFSATPCRLDGKPLGDIYDDLIETVTTADLIKQGYLSPYRYFAPAIADLSALKKKGSDFDQLQAESILATKAVYGDVIKTYREKANGKKTVIYCTTVNHSKAITEAFRLEGYQSEHIDGTTPEKERAKIIDRYRRGETQILSNVDIVSVGFDLPDIECCIMLRPTCSTALFIQQTGRALRPLPGKIAIILDHVGNYARHGLPDDQREWSLSERIQSRPEYRDDGRLNVRMCRECFFTYPTGPDVCPNCGAPVISTREEIKNIRNIQLAEIQQGRRERAAEAVQGKSLNECRNLQEVMAWCKQNGKKSGFGYLHAKRKGMVR